MPINHDAVGRLLVDNTDVALACHRIARALSGELRQSDLPGLLIDLGGANQRLLRAAFDADPDIAAAMARGLRSTEDLHRSECVKVPA